VTEAGHLVTRLMLRDQVNLTLAAERHTNQVLSEWVDESDRLTAELRLEIGHRTAAQEALQRHRDDLERVVAERTAAVVASEARLADVIETLPSALILFDAEDRLVACNAAYRALATIDVLHFKPGISYQELSRITLESGVVTMEGVAADRWLRDRAIERRAAGALAVRTEYRRDDGTWFEMYERRTRDGGTVTLRIDVTQAHRHEAMLAEHGKLAALGQLASGVAHEINNLLQPALIFPELVRDRLPPRDVEFYEYLEIVLESIRKAREVVRNVLLFARGQDAKLETVDLAVEIGAAITFIQDLLPPNISLHQQTRRLGTLVAVNKTQLTQVLTNLVLNAVHATGGHGSIEIALDQARLSSGEAEALQLEPDAAYLTLAVADNGIGMDASTLARIFEPFFTTKPLGEGTGLGLSVVFGILRGWKGAVAVASELGHGTTFTLYIPIVEPSRSTDDTMRNAC
jgi:signal transduction histidine kinase